MIGTCLYSLSDVPVGLKISFLFQLDQLGSDLDIYVVLVGLSEVRLPADFIWSLDWTILWRCHNFSKT